MRKSASVWNEIASRAATLAERQRHLISRILYRYSEQPSSEATRRLVHWREISSAGCPDQFAWRLQSLGLDPSQAIRLLDWEPLPNDVEPKWLWVLREACAAAQGTSTFHRLISDLQPSVHTVPFGEFYAPFLAVAYQTITERAVPSLCTEHLNRLRASFDRGLIQRLVPLANEALWFEFSVQRRICSSGLTRILAHNAESREQYDQFIRGIWESAPHGLFQMYPVLTRLLCQTTDQWVTYVVEFLHRWTSDANHVARHLNSYVGHDAAVDVHFGLSDLHNGGKSMASLVFSDGTQLIYKPKSLETEALFAHIVHNLADLAPFAGVRVQRVVICDNYGWAEQVKREIPSTPGERHAYAYNSGALLFLLYVLGATDMHRENVVPSTTSPVLIDLETLLHHRPTTAVELSGARTAALTLTWNSVLRTLILPMWIAFGHRWGLQNVGAVTVEEDHAIEEITRRRWRNLNTDAMEIASLEPTQLNGSMERTTGSTVNVNPEVLKKGFSDAYHVFLGSLTNRSRLEHEIRRFTGLRTRHILRPTQIYHLMMEQLSRVEFLRDGIDRSIELDRLALPISRVGSSSGAIRLLTAELSALESNNVPIFYSTPEIQSLYTEAGEEIPNMVERPAMENALRQMANLSPSDLDRQLCFIDAAFQAASTGQSTDAKNYQRCIPSSGPVGTDELLAEAVRLGELIVARAIRHTDGSIAWIGLHTIPGTDRYQFEVLDNSLYSGTVGIAVFLSALGRATNGGAFSDMATQIAADALHPLLADPIRSFRRFGLGGYQGALSVSLAAAAVARDTDDLKCLHDAYRVAANLSPREIEQTNQYDIIFGSAGSLLVLLALYEDAGDAQFLDLAIACGNHLLARAVTVDKTGGIAWPNHEGFFPTGFSHGTSGIAYALARLYRQTGYEQYLAGALKAIHFERLAFDTTRRNWSDLVSRNSNRPDDRFGQSWCHGAPGILLSRLELYELTQSSEIADEVDSALTILLAEHPDAVDHLCCGLAGHALLAAEAAVRWSPPDGQNLANRATDIVHRVYKGAMDDGYRLLPGLKRGVLDLGLMQGIAGIGLTFLRFASEAKRIVNPITLTLGVMEDR